MTQTTADTPFDIEEAKRKQNPHLAKQRNFAIFRISGALMALGPACDSALYPAYIVQEALSARKQLRHLRDKIRKVGRGEEHPARWPE